MAQGFIISNRALERALKLTNTIPMHAINVRFAVEVPGGGDYSNMELSIGQGSDDIPLQVRYELPRHNEPCNFCSCRVPPPGYRKG